MNNDQNKALFIPVDLKKRPLSVDELKQRKKQLKSALRFQHNLIIGIFVLGVAVSYQTIFPVLQQVWFDGYSESKSG